MKVYRESAKRADEYLTLATSSDVGPKPAGQAMAFVRQFLKDCFEQLPSERNDPNSSINRTIGGDIMIYLGGRNRPSFRCVCGGNVFRKTASGKYKCNSCSELYTSDKEDETENTKTK